MRLEKYYEVIPNAVSPEFCDRVVEAGLQRESMHGGVPGDPETRLRDSVLSWIPPEKDYAWIFNEIGPLVAGVNNQYWHWQLQTVESMQFTQYQTGGHYTWHADARVKPYPKEERWPGLVRKVSCSLILCDGDEFEGGDFQVEDMTSAPHDAEKRIRTLTEARSKGSLVVFPSHIFHRVMPITGGVRKSLVAWYLGKPFR